MFRNILNSVGSRGSQQMNSKRSDEKLSEDAEKISNNSTGNSTAKSIGKRSKKKLTAMMGKLNINGKNKSNNNHINNNSVGNFDDIQNDLYDEEDSEFLPANEEPITKSNLKSSIESSKLSNEQDLQQGDKNAFVLPEELCDIPTFLYTENCDTKLIEETRKLLRERYAKNPDSFYDNDYKRMLTDDWTVSRFLLRRRLDPKRTAKLMEECGRFRKQYKMSEVKLHEFPIEFHKAGGLFMYAPDRVGNLTVYMRVKMYRRVPEISDVFKAFILCVLEQCDVANNGRGTAVIFDLTGCGLQNVDLGFLSWLLSSFRNYCPKGVSYILVYNLPWILSATCKLAMTWMSASNRRALRFVHGDEIENFIAKENLPDYCGGSCEINYRAVPEGAKMAIEVCDRLDMTREQALKIRELFKEYLDEDDLDSNDNDSNLKFEDASDETPSLVNSSADLVSKASKFIT